MTDSGGLDSTDAFERFVLLTVAELTDEGGSPVISYDVMERCRERADELAEFTGGVERRKVMNALSRLADAGLLAEERGETNPTGKGRPEYTLALPVEQLLDGLADDETVASYVARFE
ncbi:MAG: hypothetical protein ABEJ06_04160 [Haloarculaceae archaeon]